ncbi:MAG: hypothetical protein LBI86_11180 [Treponema sp.]|jgi:hypothetical protein|nr:hypothetical protein [Treponema sp.]
MTRKYGYFLSVLAALFLAGSGAVYAQVDRDELEKSQIPMAFINYEGPHARIETRAQIRNIGYSLGLQVNAGTARPGASNRYFVIHSVTAPESGKLDADIFGLGVDTGVDHIRNLRRIVQGYLEAAYGYTEQDATLLAEYITIYNAVYRGNWEYFTGRYKNPVVSNLSSEKTGLSIRYDEWPGQTLMLIPLGPGGLSSVDTSSLSDSRITEELRREDDRGIEQRRDMVELKEREAEQAEQRATAEREAIREEERRIAEERSQAGRDRDNIAREQEQNRADREAGRVTPEEARGRDEALAERERDADRKEEELDRREDALAERRDEAQRSQEFAERKTEEAQSEREEIARDQQEIIDQEGSRPAAGGVLGVSITAPDSGAGRVVSLDPLSGAELKRSALSTVRARTFTQTGGKILAIAGEDRGNYAVRLVEISGDTLEMIKQGDDDIHPQSLLWVNGSDLYAVTLSDGAARLGRFNTDLARQALSPITVHPFAAVIFSGNYVITQRADGSAVLLDRRDLSEAYSGQRDG